MATISQILNKNSEKKIILIKMRDLPGNQGQPSNLAQTIVPSRINLREANVFFGSATSLPFPADFPSLFLLLLLYRFGC
jgi:hypothetical protein